MPNNSREISVKKSVDWITIFLYLVLVFFGWLSIYGASYEFDQTGGALDFSQRYGKQLIWIGLAGFMGICILLVDNRVFNYLAYFIYGFFILLLIVTLFVATDIKGSRSWLTLGPVSLQPAEFAKFATALALAKYMSSFSYRLDNIRNVFVTGLIIFVPFVIIILQNETGSALVYVAFMLVLFREGMPGIVLFLGFWAVLLFIFVIRFLTEPIGGIPDSSLGNFIAYVAIILVHIFFLYKYGKGDKLALKVLLGNIVLFGIVTAINESGLLSETRVKYIDYEYTALFSIAVSVILCTFFYFKSRKNNYILIIFFLVASLGYCYSVDYIFDNILQPHQQTRIKVTLGIEDDPSGAGYNVNQSKIAIGSGGFSGKGFLNGTQTKLKYVPEQDTDFIFCTVGEEWGFMGTSLVLLVFMALILRLIFLAERQRSVFSRIFGYSVASILFFHVAINIGMVIGLTPVIGIPLPFFSYGGSSLWGFTVLLFIFIRMDVSRSERLG